MLNSSVIPMMTGPIVNKQKRSVKLRPVNDRHVKGMFIKFMMLWEETDSLLKTTLKFMRGYSFICA